MDRKSKETEVVSFPSIRDFKGVWIPKEIYLDRELDATEKILYTEIDSLDKEDGEGCYASNEYLANFCMCSKSKVSSGISKLIDKGYIYVEKFDGRKRWLRVRRKNKKGKNPDKTSDDSQNNDGRVPENGRKKCFSYNSASHKNEERNNSIDNTFNNTFNNTDNKVFSQEEKTIYNKAFSGEKAYRSPDISYEYTEKEFKEFITKKVDHIVKEISPEEYDASVEPISAIIAYFYKRYYKCMGKRHPILTDAVYTKIIMKLIEPVEDVWKRDFRLDKTVYYAMIDQFFKTDYGVKSGNITDYRMSYFMSDTVQSNLVYRSGII